MGSVQIKGGQIVDSAIVAAKLASNAVTSAKIYQEPSDRLLFLQVRSHHQPLHQAHLIRLHSLVLVLLQQQL